MTPSPPKSRREFDIAIICALSIEADAVHDVFDVFWEKEGYHYGSAEGDHNVYTTGVIGQQNVVLAYMPGAGKVSASAVAVSLRSSFPCINLALVVGICGAVPNSSHYGKRIWLGDLVISTSIVQYDFGRQYPAAFERKDTLVDNFGRSSPKIRSLLSKLETRYYRKELQNDMTVTLARLGDQEPSQKYPGQSKDHLYHPSYIHKHRDGRHGSICRVCSVTADTICETAPKQTCEQMACEDVCLTSRDSVEQQVEPTKAFTHTPHIHFGKIGSADTVMKSGEHRDELARINEVIAFEMEGAGVWDHFPCFVVKGVSDYADSHKRKDWQLYAATVAAAGLRAFLKQWTFANTSTSHDANPSMATHRDPFHGKPSVQDPIRWQQTTDNYIRLPGEIKPPITTSSPNPHGTSHRSYEMVNELVTPQSEVTVDTPLPKNQSNVPCILNLLRSPSDAVVDIVLIHGVLDDHHSTWYDESTGTFWPSDDIIGAEDREMRNARVFVFGYDRDLFKRINEAFHFARELIRLLSIYRYNVASRPIILVAHSLGGLIVQAALNIPAQGGNPPFRDSVSGLLCFSFPYRDKAAIDHLRHLAHIDTVPSAFSKESLDSLHYESLSKLRKIAIRTFYAIEETKDGFIVKQDAFSTGTLTELVVSLPNTDHLSICKFRSLRSLNYKKVEAALDSLICNASFCKMLSMTCPEITLTRRSLDRLFSGSYLSSAKGKNYSGGTEIAAHTFDHYEKMWKAIKASYGEHVNCKCAEECKYIF